MKKTKATLTFEFDDSFDEGDIAEHISNAIRMGHWWLHDKIRKEIMRDDALGVQKSLEEDLERCEKAMATLKLEHVKL